MQGSSPPHRADVRAAGAVVTRKGGDVLLVHRPKYDDWSFPKGKVDLGEHPLAAAVREVEEETGLVVALGPRLSEQRYPLRGGRTKAVDYWVARAVGSDDVEGYLPNDEIDEVVWMPWDKAERRLTYAVDRATLAQARPLRRRTRALVVLRHTSAVPRKQWTGDDRRRPLQADGVEGADRLVPLLAAYDVQLAVSSPSTRCLETVVPWARATGRPMTLHDELSEEDVDAAAVRDLVASVLADEVPAVVCSHRPVLPDVMAAAGAPGTGLRPGAMVVVHHRKGRVVATESHELPGPL